MSAVVEALPEPVLKSASPRPALHASAKLQSHHLERLAVVFVRQSTQRQVLVNRESTEVQYKLTRRAEELGWSKDRIIVIDDDLGESASTSVNRSGFQRLLAEVAMNHVGLVLGIELSRIARSCKDWHHLFDLCAMFRAVLADHDGLYDPSDFNDRLLLGLKGIMSEAELHLIRSRMDHGRRNKAERGDLFNTVPIGFVRLPNGGVDLDPDQQAQAVVHLVFEKFEELGSVRQLTRYFVMHGIQIPIRPHGGPNRDRLEWRRPRMATLYNMLRHPFYAGAYVYGRRRTDPRRKIPGRPNTGKTVVAMEQWPVLLKNALPAYITWEQFLANQQRLKQNRSRWNTLGAPREGCCLLAGLVSCGKCQRRMRVFYPGTRSIAHYACERSDPMERCEAQDLAAGPTDELVQRQVLLALDPASLELSLKAEDNLRREHRQLSEHWKQKMERAAYQSDRARRQYEAVEPENRLVARELEQRWEKALNDERGIKEEYDRFQATWPGELSEQDRDSIRQLSSDIPALWESPSTTIQDRQAVVRQLIERVAIDTQGKTEVVDVTIHWIGGFVSQHEVRRSLGRYEQLRDFHRLVARLTELRNEGQTSARIAHELNQEGFHTPKGTHKKFSGVLVRSLLMRLGLCRRTDSPGLLEPDEWWAHDLCRKLNVPFGTLKGWIQSGWIHARKIKMGLARWVVWADHDELVRLQNLRDYRRRGPRFHHPKELTTPKPKPET